MTPRAAEGPGGFTLLEVLAAVAVLGLIIAGIAGGVQFGQRAASVQARAIDAVTDVDSAERLLRGLIAGMDPGSIADPPHVEGRAGTLGFTTVLPDGAADGLALADVGLGVDAAGRLMLRWTPALHAIRLGPPPPPGSTVLAEGLAGISFAYWRPRPGGGEWLSEWAEEVIPPLVRIQFRFDAHSRRTWPDIIAGTLRLRPAR